MSDKFDYVHHQFSLGAAGLLTDMQEKEVEIYWPIVAVFCVQRHLGARVLASDDDDDDDDDQ